MKSVDDLLERLYDNSRVAGLIRYGSDPALSGYRTGDLDLFVVMGEQELEVESLHFDVGGVPVDLNLLTLEALSVLEPDFTFPALALRDADVIFDRDGAVGAALSRLRAGFVDLQPQALSAHDVAFMRHGHRHALDKLRGRLGTEPLLASVLLNTNVYQLLQSYFRVWGLPFLGERKSLAYLQEHEPELCEGMGAFYSSDDLEEKVRLTETMTARVLEPVGGAWRRGEVLAFAHTDGEPGEGLAQEGLEVYRALLGSTS